MKLKARGSALVASALAILLVPSLLSLAPANAAGNSANSGANNGAGGGSQRTAPQIYKALDSAKNPQASFEALSTSDKSTFNDYFLPTTSVEAVTITPVSTSPVAQGTMASTTYSSLAAATEAMTLAASGCWGTYTKVTMYAAAGNALWSTYNQGTWCYNGTTVTSATFSRSWSTIAAIGWRDAGQIGRGSGITSNRARIWSQRKMILGTGGWDIQTSQPCNRLNGTAAGGASVSLTCSIY